MGMGVTIEDLSVSFFDKEVLHGVSARFSPKSLSVLIGRSGSGKTTLLRSINRLNEEFEGCTSCGQVLLTTAGEGYRVYPSKVDSAKGFFPQGGETESFGSGKNMPLASDNKEARSAVHGRMLSLTELRLRVGMVFQTPNVFPVSVYKNIAMPLTLVGGCSKKDAEAKVHDALALVGLWDEVKDGLEKSAERLSGGQQQRLCLARVLALRPQVLLLDEPTASLDVHSGRHIEELLAQLAQDYTIIMVSHGLSQARRLGSKILICKAGRITHELQAGSDISEDILEEVV